MGFRHDARYPHQVKDAASLFLGPENQIPTHQVGGLFIPMVIRRSRVEAPHLVAVLDAQTPGDHLALVLQDEITQVIGSQEIIHPFKIRQAPDAEMLTFSGFVYKLPEFRQFLPASDPDGDAVFDGAPDVFAMFFAKPGQDFLFGFSFDVEAEHKMGLDAVKPLDVAVDGKPQIPEDIGEFLVLNEMCIRDSFLSIVHIARIIAPLFLNCKHCV